MSSVREILNAEKAKRVQEIREIENAIGSLVSPKAAEVTAPIARAAKLSPVKAENHEAKRVRAPDSELTKARKRLAACKRFGKSPDQADVDLVATSAGATAKAAE